MSQGLEPLLLRVEDAAKCLSLGRSKTYELIASGVIPVVRIGRSTRVSRSALEAWIEGHSRNGANEQARGGQ